MVENATERSSYWVTGEEKAKSEMKPLKIKMLWVGERVSSARSYILTKFLVATAI